MENITTKAALISLTDELRDSPEYYNAWVNVMAERVIYQWNIAVNKDDIGAIAKNGAKDFIDFLIKEYAGE